MCSSLGAKINEGKFKGIFDEAAKTVDSLGDPNASPEKATKALQ